MSRFQDAEARLASTFIALDEERRKLALKLKKMRDEEAFREGGYATFEQFCDAELQKHGGYARVKRILDEVQ